MASLDSDQGGPQAVPIITSQQLRNTLSPETSKIQTNMQGQGLAAVNSNDRRSSVTNPRRFGKKSSSQLSATEWFKNANENVQTRQDGLQHEPPFYLGNQNVSSSEEAEDAQPSASAWTNARFASRDSENSDLRDVIDDLTVENRQLRERLRKYEAANVADMNPDKMFELRVHALSSGKKKDLEDLLTDFVSKVNMKDRRTPQAGSSSNVSHNISTSAKSNTRSSKHQVSTPSMPGDSAYASQSAQTKSAQSGPSGPSSSNNDPSQTSAKPQSTKSRDRNVRTYLHNIPESLLPKVNPVMSDRTKKKILVQRLEYLFTGRTAAPGPHSQPMQQQEISNTAAREDLSKIEGTREARIMTPGQKRSRSGDSEPQKDANTDDSSDEPRSNSGNRSPDQRPTRPLDLDIQRAQIPEDNLRYIRHLGLSSPTRHGDSCAEGWVYLNLLINMAQLHTMNVTPDFVRKAVAEMSEMFELSPDGRKVRWKGGDEGTKFSSDSGDNGSGVSPDDSTTSLNQLGNAPSRDGSRAKNRSSSSGVFSGLPFPSQSMSGIRHGSGSMNVSSSSLPLTSKGSPWRYKPVVLRQHRSTESDEFLYPDSQSTSRFGREDTTGRSSSNAMTQSRTTSSSKKTGSNAPIIFYRNALFYTDLTGDQKGLSKCKAPVDDSSGQILGLPPREDIERDANYHQPVLKDDVRPLSEEELSVELPALEVIPLSDVSETHQNFKEFPVCGLGGVVPADNFLIDVNTRHSLTPPLAKKGKQVRGKAAKYSVISQKQYDLPPSRLPMPSYISFVSNSSSDLTSADDDGDDDDVDVAQFTEFSADKKDVAVPPAMLTQMSSSEYADDSDDGAEASDSSSVDMLDVERAVDPEGDVARGRGDSPDNIDGVHLDELPAGSSAATAGGGSGYHSGAESPISTIIGPPSLKRGQSAMESVAPLSARRKTLRTD